MKPKTIPPLSPAVIETFWRLCDSTHEAFALHRVLFDENPNKRLLRKSHYSPILGTLSRITQEYALLQLVKLHDPTVQQGNVNFGLEYVRKHGRWDTATAKQLKVLHRKLNELFEKIKPARDRILCHNDYRTIMKNRRLGGFPKNADEEYFETLRQFVTAVQGTLFVYSEFTETDARILIDGLVRDCEQRRKRMRRFRHSRKSA